MKLTGKNALVTGAGRGIGKGCALELAKNGADLVVNDRPDSPDLVATCREIEALGQRAVPITANVFERAGCEQLVAEALAAIDRIDILISNPACVRRDDFLDFDPNDFRTVIQGSLVSGFDLAQLVARHMVERSIQGKIVFISSVHAEVPAARCAAYNAAKAGLNQLARTIAAELSPHKINVNCIEPGWIDTPGERKIFSDEQITAAAAELPWKRLGTPQDIGKAAAFLASDDADYMTGSVLRIDGGLLLKDATP